MTNQGDRRLDGDLSMLTDSDRRHHLELLHGRGLPRWMAPWVVSTDAVVAGIGIPDVPWVHLDGRARVTAEDQRLAAASGVGLRLYADDDLDLRHFIPFLEAGGKGLAITRSGGRIQGDHDALSRARGLEILIADGVTQASDLAPDLLPALKRLEINGGAWADLARSRGLVRLFVKRVDAQRLKGLPATLQDLSLDLSSPLLDIEQLGRFPVLENLWLYRQRRFDLSTLLQSPRLEFLLVGSIRELRGAHALTGLERLRRVVLGAVREIDDIKSLLIAPHFSLEVSPNYVIQPEDMLFVPAGKMVVASSFRVDAPPRDGRLSSHDLVIQPTDGDFVVAFDGWEALESRLRHIGRAVEATGAFGEELMRSMLRGGRGLDAALLEATGGEVFIVCSTLTQASAATKRIVQEWNDEEAFRSHVAVADAASSAADVREDR